MYKRILDNGSLLTINRCGACWTVDIWPWDAESTDEPVYHAAYATALDAQADALSWRAWPEPAQLVAPGRYASGQVVI